MHPMLGDTGADSGPQFRCLLSKLLLGVIVSSPS
uniref:Uncharacterized protein n=1 Tax=Arundo donax TaxID=35708 RepID=A0A0A9DCF3_ARUDO